ncbi:DUF6851 domain-containing protein [uncultured Roseobacter sp.]|uniref:DUF6851 domain-containing protein n=1 Tax=uncultured Roseobacter sp. TaxID=114847 RepID=UPI0026212152|nr:hypothetical protein [uncultured Roseobacter sp.]
MNYALTGVGAAVPNQSLVAQWNELMLEAIRTGSAKPTETTYQLYLASTAIYDAWAALDEDAYGQYSEITTNLAGSQANKAEAVSFAAYAALTKLFPAQQAAFDAFMDELGYDPADASTSPATAAGLGTLAAQNVFKAREDDGSNAENGLADTSGYSPVNSADPGTGRAPGGDDFNPNHWQPLRVPTGVVTDADGLPIVDETNPASYVDQIALTPHWGSVTSFALAENDMFRPDAPPKLGDFSAYVDGTGKLTTGDQAYRDQITEVIEISARLTTEQKVIAELWADGPRTESPPGHWNQIAQDIALREGHGIDEDAKMFFALNAAVFDAGIATWEAKYTYDYVRPQSAIRDLYFGATIEAWGGVNKGRREIAGETWQPYQNVTFVTPPFPEYVSGHSTFSMAAAKTIASFVGSDVYYDGTSLSNYDLDNAPGIDLLGEYEARELAFEDFGGGAPVVLRWNTLTEAAEEAGISRLYGGIHIQDGNLNGLEVGKSVAANAETRWEALFSRGGDDDIDTGRAGGLTIAGAGDDTVTGGRDNDTVEGGSGDDTVSGGRGNDTLSGGTGDDDLDGGRDDDTLEGGHGDDNLSGGRGDDFMRGDAGADLLKGELGDDRLLGDWGDDVIYGSAGFDELRGGKGDDTLSGGDGFDMIWGGAGADSFLLKNGETSMDQLRDFDADEDTLFLVGFAPGANLVLQQQASQVMLRVDGDEVAALRGVDANDLIVESNILFVDSFVA